MGNAPESIARAVSEAVELLTDEDRAALDLRFVVPSEAEARRYSRALSDW